MRYSLKRPELNVFALSFILIRVCSGWMSSSTTPIFRYDFSLKALLPENYQEIGNKIITEAAESCGAAQDQLSITWKSGTIIVTVDGNVRISTDSDDDDDDNNDAAAATGVDVGNIARSINAALDDGSIGYQIAESHEVEVTTPGAPDEVSGVMWEVYCGFDVIAQFQDTKKNKVKTIEGKLYKRTDETTTINIKGRMKKIKNEDVISVKLPKAKREKGG